MVSIPSRHSVGETLDRLEGLVKEKGMTVFARINFTRDAEHAGLSMQQAELLIFGNPRVGTPIMVDRPTVAIDLPLKALAWEDRNGEVRLSYNDPGYLGRRHGLDSVLVESIRGVALLLQKAAE